MKETEMSKGFFFFNVFFFKAFFFLMLWEGLS